MKIIIITLSVVVSLTGLTGCNRSYTETATAEPTPAAHYKAGHGLQFTPTAAKFMQLETAEVGSRDVGESKGVAAIPTAAVLRTVKGDFVYVANGEWMLRTAVTLGATDGVWTEVKDGLYEGDSIVTRGTQALWMAELQAVNGGVGCADGH